VQHVDPDQLALLALGETVDPSDGSAVSSHLRQCASCRREFESLRHTVELGREAVELRDTAPPPEAVWTRIAAEVEIGMPPAGPAPRAPLIGQHRAPEPAEVPIGSRRRWARPVAALLAAAAIGVLGTLGALRPWRSDPAPTTTSTATLAAVAGGPRGVTGRAVVVRGPSGSQLRVTADRLPLQQGYYEVWAYDGQRNMVSLGVLGADSTASLPLPPTLDLRTYHVIDISQERYDGDQTHSRTSVLRGTLTN
jgi:anti-sigma-K factor RskA